MGGWLFVCLHLSEYAVVHNPAAYACILPRMLSSICFQILACAVEHISARGKEQIHTEETRPNLSPETLGYTQTCLKTFHCVSATSRQQGRDLSRLTFCRALRLRRGQACLSQEGVCANVMSLTLVALQVSNWFTTKTETSPESNAVELDVLEKQKHIENLSKRLVHSNELLAYTNEKMGRSECSLLRKAACTHERKIAREECLFM